MNKERVKKLTRIYSNIIRTNFKEEQKDIKNYINIYTDRKPINVNNKYGSINDQQEEENEDEEEDKNYLKKNYMKFIPKRTESLLRDEEKEKRG